MEVLEFGCSERHPGSCLSSVGTFQKLLGLAVERLNGVHSTCNSHGDLSLVEESFVFLGLFLLSNSIRV